MFHCVAYLTKYKRKAVQRTQKLLVLQTGVYISSLVFTVFRDYCVMFLTDSGITPAGR